MSEELKQELRCLIGGCDIEDKGHAIADNVAIMLCTYFERHPARPENDPINEDKGGWGVWALKKQEEALDLITTEIVHHSKHIKALQEQLRWRSIESGELPKRPKTGLTKILYYSPRYGVPNMLMLTSTGKSDWVKDFGVTHWLPIPPLLEEK